MSKAREALAQLNGEYERVYYEGIVYERWAKAQSAELEASLWSRECLGHDRVATFAELSHRTRAWNAHANHDRRSINWRFTTTDARRVFHY